MQKLRALKPLRLRTVEPNSDLEGLIASEGVVTYAERGSDAKKGHTVVCPFCSKPNLA